MISSLLHTKKNSDIVCVDISHNMLTYSPVPAVQANALSLPFQDESFDLIVAAAFFHHLPGMEGQLLNECYRILKPNGRLVGYDPSASCIQNNLFMRHNKLRLKVFSPDEKPILPERIRTQSLDAGFKQFNYFTFSFKNSKLTIFEFIQRYILAPFSFGPLKMFLDRWFFWEAVK